MQGYPLGTAVRLPLHEGRVELRPDPAQLMEVVIQKRHWLQFAQGGRRRAHTGLRNDVAITRPIRRPRRGFPPT